MRRIDEVIKEIDNSEISAEISHGVWVPAQSVPFQYGIMTTGYWRRWLCRLVDAWKVLTGYAEAIDWGQGKKH